MVLGAETNAIFRRAHKRAGVGARRQKKSFLTGCEQAVRVLYKEGYLEDDDIFRVAYGAYVKVLSDRDHANWWPAMKEFLARVHGKPAEKLEVGLTKQLMESITLVPHRDKIAELPLPEFDKKVEPASQEGDQQAPMEPRDGAASAPGANTHEE